jgi:hypothetical protein
MLAPAVRVVVVCLAGLGLLACAPALDWRDVRPAGSAALLLLPCRPVAQQRPLMLAGHPVQMHLQACSAGGQTWGLAYADVNDPARLGPALTELQAAAAANIGASLPAAAAALQVPGSTPHAGSARVKLTGRMPDGAAVQMQVAVFCRGTVAFQATALGPHLDGEAAETFFASIRFAP